MFTDHSSIMLYALGFVSYDTYLILRSIGRIAFPVYCFLLVNGFGCSSDKRKYLKRLMVFALISQIPFSLYFSYSCFGSLHLGAPHFRLELLPFLVTAVLFTVLYFLGSKKPGPGELLLLFAFIILPGVSLRFGNVYILDGHMSIFYSLFSGLLLLCFISALKDRRLSIFQFVFAAAFLAAVLYFIQPRADYGISAVILIAGLYLLRSKKVCQAGFICLWAFLQYGTSGIALIYSIFACLSGAAILFYNGRKGPSGKYFFYSFYPVHLLLLALLSLLKG